MRIGFIGAGNMATALALAIDRGEEPATFTAYDVDIDRLRAFGSSLPSFVPSGSNAEVCSVSDVVILAVKPQALPDLLPDLRDADALVVSILAGVTIARLEGAMPAARVVRVMPNTPALVGRMAAGYAAGTRTTPADLEIVGKLLASAGVAFELSETLLDAVTGLSGSGPAFVARLIEAFAEAGTAQGLPGEVAYRLALATFSGTAALLEQRDLSPEALVTMVSSRGGTTVAGRSVLEASQYKRIIAETVAAAAARSKELGS